MYLWALFRAYVVLKQSDHHETSILCLKAWGPTVVLISASEKKKIVATLTNKKLWWDNKCYNEIKSGHNEIKSDYKDIKKVVITR